MRKIMLILAVAAVSSALTAGAIVLPAAAGEGDGTRADSRRVLPALPFMGDEKSRARIEEFEACMKEHGFDLAGPETRIEVGPDGVRVNGESVDAGEFRAAQRECGPPFRGVPFGGRLDGEAPPELREHMKKLRSCLEAEEV